MSSLLLTAGSGRSNEHDHNPITQGPLLNAVWSLFFPTLLALAASGSIGIVDIYLSGLLGSAEQAAVGMADQILFFVTMGGAGLATACVAHVARFRGMQDVRSSQLCARDCLLLSLLTGCLAAVFCYFASAPIIHLFNSERHTELAAVSYARANSPANAAYMVALCLVAVLRAMNRPRIGLVVWSLMSSISIILSFVFFFIGPHELRSLGGLGVAWDIGSAVGTSVGFILLVRFEPDFRQVLFSDFSSSPARIFQLVCTAVPAVTAELAPIIANFAIYRILSVLPASSAAQAAWTIRMKLEETFAIMPLAALAMAMAVVVSQNLGAAHNRRARVCAVSTCAVATIAMIPMGAILSQLAPSIVRLFSQDDLACRYSVVLLSPYYVILPAMALSQILLGVLDGAAMTKIPMSINCIGLVAVRCGLAFSLVSAGQGIGGLADSTLYSAVCVALLSVGCFVKFFLINTSLTALPAPTCSTLAG